MIAPCLPLCAAVCALTGLGGVPAPLRGFWAVSPPFGRGYEDNRVPCENPAQRFSWGEAELRNERFFALLGGNEGYGASDDEKRDKAMAPLPALSAITTARSAGSLRGFSGGRFLASVSGRLFTTGVCRPQTADGCRVYGGI